MIPVTGVELRTSSITLRVGKNTQISLEPLPYNANPVTWQFRSQDETIASVNETGLISAKAPGRTMITVQCEENDQIQMEISLNILDLSQAPRKRAAVSPDLKTRISEILQAAIAESHS